jgi:glycosyltransferase involved in cell wall biosynthesis
MFDQTAISTVTGGAEGALRRPRVGIDLHVVDGIYQGSRTHCLELFSRVVEIMPACQFVLFLSQPSKLLEFSANFSLPNVRIVSMPHAPAIWRLVRQLPRLARQEQLDLLHTQYITPPLAPCRTALTVHDILFESHPQYFDRLFVARSRLLVRPSVRKSTEVFTVSEFSRNQIAGTYGIGLERIHTIFNGVDQARFFPGEDGSEAIRRAGLTPGDYFLTVGRLEPRKNHASLMRAWAALPVPRPRLAIAGARHFGYDEALRLRETLGLKDDVNVFDNISDEDLPSYFRNAKAFIYCSWAEGFGMPVLEAMASGVPVISSANTALQEVCGDAALLIDPADISAIRDAICSVDSQPHLRSELTRRGLERAQHYKWAFAANTVREVYLNCLGVKSSADVTRWSRASSSR